MFDCVPKTPLLPVKKKKKQIVLYYFTYFYIILYDFINCLAFIDVKQTLYYKVAIE